MHTELVLRFVESAPLATCRLAVETEQNARLCKVFLGLIEMMLPIKWNGVGSPLVDPGLDIDEEVLYPSAFAFASPNASDDSHQKSPPWS